MSHFRSIHYLRGIAAVMVVVFHVSTIFPTLDPGLAKTFWFQSGVDIFFIISGFVMVISTRKNNFVEKFLFDRTVRIVPIYWIITLFLAMTISRQNAAMLLPSLSFLPVHDAETGQLVSTIIPPAWTLNLEMFFYLIFAFLLKLPYVKKLTYFVMIFAGLQLAYWAIPSPGLGFYANPIIIEFWLGMVLAGYHHYGRWWMVPVGLVLLWVPAVTSVMGTLSFAPGAFLLVAGTLSLESRLKEVAQLRILGDISYVLYLMHMAVITLSVAAFGHLLAAIPMLFLVLVLVLSIGASLLVHRVVEKPLILFMKNRNRPYPLAS